MSILKYILIILSSILFLNISFAKLIFDFTGKVVNVYDGDTIWIEHGNKVDKIRILGIDTPEIINPSVPIKPYKFYGCGNQAKNFAKKLLEGKIVSVYKDSLAKSNDKYGRFLRYVFIKIKTKNGKNYKIPYGALAIYKGYAKVYKYEKFTFKKAYYKLQDIAKSKKIGIWSSYCKNEDQLNKQKYLNSDKDSYPTKDYNHNYTNNFMNNSDISKEKISCGYTYRPPGCNIKGNINKKGIKIYHLPGWKYYNQTRISPDKGERRFCTEIEAIKCGRRASYIK